VTQCTGGTIASFERNDDRCVIQIGCVPTAICPLFRPACSAGYTLASWVGDSGCAQYACDPTFVAH
jgi:hypothetical protein